MPLTANLTSALICSIQLVESVRIKIVSFEIIENIFLTGHGRKRRAIEHDKNATEFTKFKENLQYTVLMPGELTNDVKYKDSGDQCRNFVMISGLLAGLLALSTIIVSRVRLNMNSTNVFLSVRHAVSHRNFRATDERV